MLPVKEYMLDQQALNTICNLFEWQLEQARMKSMSRQLNVNICYYTSGNYLQKAEEHDAYGKLSQRCRNAKCYKNIQ